MTDAPTDGESQLSRLVELGQAPWLDSIARSWLDDGSLVALRDRFSLLGVTSNPSIFDAALQSGTYDDDIRVLASGGLDDRAIFHRLATDDVRRACDAFAAVHQATGDGHVSIEVDPDLAHDTAATVDQARALWSAIDRPNLMVKIPATEAGIPAIEQVLAEGVNVNVTLLFDPAVARRVREAWINGLERRLGDGGDVARVASVASFFVSRVDTKVDALLAAAEHEDAHELRGTAAVANAAVAWADAQQLASDPRWRPLEAAGARPQRLLWASTGTKDPSYAATKYVHGLVADGTVNTMPLATLEALAASTDALATSLDEPRVLRARRELDRLAEAGVDVPQALDELRDEGVAAFVTAFDSLLAHIAHARTVTTTAG